MPNNILLKIVNAFLIIGCLMIVADLNEDINDYRYFSETFKSFRISETKPSNMGSVPGNSKRNNQSEKYLVLLTDEGSEWFIKEDQKLIWTTLADERNVGKQLKFYNRGDQYLTIDPVRLELDGKVVYDRTRAPFWKYLVLVVTFGLTVYNIWFSKEKRALS